MFCGFGGGDFINPLDAGNIFLGGEGRDVVVDNLGTFYGEEGSDYVLENYGTAFTP